MGNTTFDTDDNALIQTIKDSVKPEILTIGTEQFVTGDIQRAPLKDLVGSLRVSTLTALADYLNHKVDETARLTVAIHVVSPTQVDILKQVNNDDDRRFNPIYATADVPTINLLQGFQSQETAMIELQAKFVQEGLVTDLLKSLGNIVLDDEITLEDDGITQRFTVASGVERKYDNIENPVLLYPFRTFAEIEQPGSKYIFRMKKEGNGTLSIALFEADGGKWRNEARQSIKAFLTEALEGEYAILA